MCKALAVCEVIWRASVIISKPDRFWAMVVSTVCEDSQRFLALGNCKQEANNLLSLACKPRLCQNPTPCSQGRFIGVLFSSTCMESSSKWMNWKNLRIQISFCLRLFSLVFFWSLWFYDIRIWGGSRHSWVRKNQFTSFIITLLEQFTEPCMRASFFCHWQAWWSPDCTVRDTR